MRAALALENFSGFKRPRFPRIEYLCMTEYDCSFGLPFGPEDVRNTRPRCSRARGSIP